MANARRVATDDERESSGRDVTTSGRHLRMLNTDTAGQSTDRARTKHCFWLCPCSVRVLTAHACLDSLLSGLADRLLATRLVIAEQQQIGRLAARSIHD